MPPPTAPPPPDGSSDDPSAAARPRLRCLNCDGVFADGPAPRFCPHCGQATALHPLPPRERLREFIARDIVRPARTLALLLGVPGRLTADYIAGRRLRYILPRQLFLGAAFVFFFAVKLLPALQVADGPGGKAGANLHVGAAGPSKPGLTIHTKARAKALAAAASAAAKAASEAASDAASDAEAAALADQIASSAERVARSAGATVAAGASTPTGERSATDKEADSEKDDDDGPIKIDPGDADGPWTMGSSGCDIRPVRRGASAPAGSASAASSASTASAAAGRRSDCNWLERRAQLALQHWEDDPTRAREDYTAKALSTAPYAVFLMLPMFAALVMLHYIVRHRRFSDHLVFGMHLHAFWFIVALVVALAPRGVPTWPLLLYVPVYGLVAMRRVYGGGWFATFARASSISFVYMILMSIAAALLALVVALL